MADFFDVVIKDVELSGAGADTSEPVSAVNASRYAFPPFPFLYAGILLTPIPSLRTMDGSVTPIQLRKKNCTPMLLLLHFSVSHVASLFICLCSLVFFSNVRFLRYDCVTHFRLWHVFWLLTMGSVLYVFTSYYGVAPILLDPCFLCVRK